MGSAQIANQLLRAFPEAIRALQDFGFPGIAISRRTIQGFLGHWKVPELNAGSGVFGSFTLTSTSPLNSLARPFGPREFCVSGFYDGEASQTSCAARDPHIPTCNDLAGDFVPVASLASFSLMPGNIHAPPALFIEIPLLGGV